MYKRASRTGELGFSSSTGERALSPKSRRRALNGKNPDIVEQWVDKVLNFSSQYDSESWSAACVIGPPRVYPQYGDIAGAWAQEGSTLETEWIEVSFKEKIYIEEIDIYETYHAGAVVKVSAQNPKGAWVTLFQTPNATVIRQSRIFSPEIQKTTFPANVLRIEQDLNPSQNWCEIDCIQIKGSRNNAVLPPIENRLVEDLGKLVNNSLFSDICFELKGSKFIYAHKAIISSRSDYFRTTFCDNMQGSDNKKAVQMTNEDYDAFLQLMKYLYTDDIDENLSAPELVELMRLAGRMCVGSLQSLAHLYLMDQLNVGTVVDIYNDAISQQPILDTLSKQCLQFMSQNWKKISKTHAFQKLPRHVMQQLESAMSQLSI